MSEGLLAIGLLLFNFGLLLAVTGLALYSSEETQNEKEWTFSVDDDRLRKD